MTSFDRVDGRPARADRDDAPRGLIGTEFAETLKLAIPLALTQLAQIAMMTTDLALIGRLGTDAVAAAALGQTVSFMSFVIGMGLVSAVAPLAAQAFGARDPHRLRRALRVGLWGAFFVGVPIAVFQLFGKKVLLALGQTPASAELASHYLRGMALAVLPGLWAIAIRGFMGSVNRPEPGLWIMLAAIPLNALTAYALIYGAFGLPRLELFGAGLGTAIVNWAMCIASVVAVHAMRPFRKFRVFGHVFRADWVLLRELVTIGAPISIAFALEYGMFGSAALLMGLISPVAVTAHQIALNVAAVLFMVPFGIGMAATVRVGHAIGRGEPSAVRRAGVAALVLGVIFMTVMTAIVLYDARRGRRAVPRRWCGERCLHADGGADPGRRDLLYRRWHPDRCRGQLARHERHAHPHADVGDRLLGDRLCRFLPAWLRDQPRRGRGLDRAVARHRGVRGDAGHALCGADAAALLTQIKGGLRG